MKRSLSILVPAILILGPLTSSHGASTPKLGQKCTKLGISSKIGSKNLKCIKTGNMLTWQISPAAKSSPTPTPSVTSTPAPSSSPTPIFVPAKAPTSFEDLYENRKGISYSAWLKVSESIKGNSTKIGSIEVATGPSTVGHFNNIEFALGLVSRAFPNATEPKKVIVVRYQFKDLQWAETEIHKYVTQQEYDELNRNEGGRLLSSNCDSSNKNCEGSKQVTTQSGSALILQGVPNTSADERMTTGMLEAHEYFHALQRIPLLGKPTGPDSWPRAWIREGSAEWVQNVVINSTNFEKYQNYIHADCSYPVANLSESEIAEFFTASSDEQINKKYDQWLNYCLGAYGIETLVALKGQGSIINLYSELATGIGFNSSFKNVYGIEPEKALTQVAKAVYANNINK